MSIPDSLSDADMTALWISARQRLDKYGDDKRGTIKLPHLTDAAALTLSSLLGKKLTARIDLTELEHALCTRGVGQNLSQSLELLGAPVSAARQASRAAGQRRAAARASVEAVVQCWPEPWCEEWVEWLFRSGLMANYDASVAEQLVLQVRRVMNFLQVQSVPVARNDLAVNLFGSSHALDDGNAIERAARRALWHTLNKTPDYTERRAVWSAAGTTTDRVSTPMLTWGLRLHPDTALGRVCAAANDAEIPLHLTALALSQNELRCHPERQAILMVENPRLVEAAAERKIDQTVITTNGNPTATVTVFVQAMLKKNIDIRYHGDFDAAGILICKRMFEMGCRPWLMDAQHYMAALERASQQNVKLPVDETDCPQTPWDVDLQKAMLENKLVVHEELLIDEVLQVPV